MGGHWPLVISVVFWWIQESDRDEFHLQPSPKYFLKLLPSGAVG